MSKCRSCGAPIIWITTKAGKAIPCDAEPIFFNLADLDDKDAKFLIKDDGEVAKGIVNPAGDLVGHTSHFATCPQADKWRRK